MRQAFDTIVIGGGPTGVKAALGARGRTALIDDHGTATPAVVEDVMTTAFIAAVEAGSGFEAAQQAAQQAGSDYAARLPQKQALQAAGVAVLTGHASFLNPKKLSFDHDQLAATVVIIATGSQAVIPTLDGTARPQAFPMIYSLKRRPKRVVVTNLRSPDQSLLRALCRLGIRVTLIAAETPPAVEPWQVIAGTIGTTQKLQRSYRVNYHTATEAANLGADVVLSSGQLRPRLDLDLDKAAIGYDVSGIIVNSRGRTSQRQIYAIGSCAQV